MRAAGGSVEMNSRIADPGGIFGGRTSTDARALFSEPADGPGSEEIVTGGGDCSPAATPVDACVTGGSPEIDSDTDSTPSACPPETAGAIRNGDRAAPSEAIAIPRSEAAKPNMGTSLGIDSGPRSLERPTAPSRSDPDPTSTPPAPVSNRRRVIPLAGRFGAAACRASAPSSGIAGPRPASVSEPTDRRDESGAGKTAIRFPAGAAPRPPRSLKPVLNRRRASGAISAHRQPAVPRWQGR